MTEETTQFLKSIMSQYTQENSAKPKTFRRRINKFLAMDDGYMEGYGPYDIEAQREKSVKFEWGHNHDFGKFKLDGVMGDRHIELIAYFIDELGLPQDLTDKKVLDVGVWCGGTSLLLAGMGAKVYAIEEVKKYADCANFLLNSFAHLMGRWPIVTHKSLYDYTYGGPFDYIIFPGVLYHLSDPIVALRILFNLLKDGGELYLETAYAGGDEAILHYHGPTQTGHNWFLPTPNALHAMLNDVGFLEFSGVLFPLYERRYMMQAKRLIWKPMMRAGLSRRIL